jgi:hypothetical protein
VLSQKGSYTIEAAVWVSLLLMMIAMALKSGIFIFTEIVNQGQNEKLQKIDIVQEFYNYQILEEIIQEVTDD